MSAPSEPGRLTEAEAWTSRTTPLVPPVYHAVTYGLDDKSYEDIEAGGLTETWYGRFSNPTVQAAAEPIRRLEGTAAALLTASGMAAIASTLVTLLRAGDRVVAARAVYGDTRDLLGRDLRAFGITVDLVDGHDLDAWRAALAAGPVAVAYGETLANPTLRLLDIAAVAELTHAAGARLVVDNTFATPFAVRPAAAGRRRRGRVGHQVPVRSLGRDRRRGALRRGHGAGGAAAGGDLRRMPGPGRGLPALARPADLRGAAGPADRLGRPAGRTRWPAGRT